MSIKKHIPNFLTCCNLLCGCIGIINVFDNNSFILEGNNFQSLIIASYLIFLACIFDFLDGFVARILKVSSPIGKELDSLADVVTFGVLPGFIIYNLLFNSIVDHLMNTGHSFGSKTTVLVISSIALLIPIFSALRLAKFNIDTRQSDSFIGVPTPANAILIASLPLILANSEIRFLEEIILNPYFLIGLTLIMSFLLVAELPLFALKFKSFKWTDNKIRYSFLLASAAIFVFLGWAAIPVIIFLYVGLSFVDNKFNKKTQSL